MKLKGGGFNLNPLCVHPCASPNPNKFCSIKTTRMFNKSITRNALCQAKSRESHQHTDGKRIKPEYEKYRMRNILRSAGHSFIQPMLHAINTTRNHRINPDANTPIITFRCNSGLTRRAFDEAKSEIISTKSCFFDEFTFDGKNCQSR